MNSVTSTIVKAATLCGNIDYSLLQVKYKGSPDESINKILPALIVTKQHSGNATQHRERGLN
jgi:hypothetical protein